MRRWQTFSLFALSELVCTKNVFYPILLFPLLSHPKLIPFWSVTDRQRNLNTPCYLSSFFFPLSARGPTRRRNSTGLAELWGGWPIEQVKEGFCNAHYFYLRLPVVLFMDKPPQGLEFTQDHHASSPYFWSSASVLLAVVAIIALSLWPQWLLDHVAIPTVEHPFRLIEPFITGN